MTFLLRQALGLTLLASVTFGVLCDVAAQTIPIGPAGEAFYTPPTPLPHAEHGAVIWTGVPTMTAALPSAARNILVLYQSIDLNGGPIAVSGTLAIPPGAPPSDGWPLITWTHGTTGIGPACAPSKDQPAGSEHPYLEPIRAMLDQYVKQGYAIAFSDFQGLGTPGLHPFLQGEAEARGALDIIRAARQIDPQIGRRYVVMGHSQGGQADLFTASFGRSYVPELTLLGNVAFAPASNLTGRFESMTKASEPSLAVTYLIYVLQSFASNHPEIGLKLILTPEALSHLPQTRQECVSKTLSEGYWARAIPKDQFLPGADLSAVLKLADANDPGVVRIPVPTLVMQGMVDVTVDPADTDLLVRKLCNKGMEVAYRVVQGADHETVVKEGNREAQAWVQARFAGAPATSNCNALPSASVRQN